MDLKLHQLRALVQVVEHGGIRAAARATDLTQAALTKSLRQLEEDVGAALLMRSARGATLTDTGQRVHARAQLILRELELAQHGLEAAAMADRHRVNAVLSPGVVAAALPTAFGRFRRGHPDVELGLFEGLAHKALPALRSGAADFALLLDDGDLSPEEFRVRGMGSAVLTPVVRSGHPVLQSPTLAAMARLEWLFHGLRNGPQMERFRAMFHRAGMPAPHRMLQCDAIVALDLLHHTDVAMMLPLRHQDPFLASGALVTVPVPELTQSLVKLSLVTRRDARLTPVAEALVRELLHVLADEAAPAAQQDERHWA